MYLKLWHNGDVIRYRIILHVNENLIFHKIISHKPQKIFTTFASSYRSWIMWHFVHRHDPKLNSPSGQNQNYYWHVTFFKIWLPSGSRFNRKIKNFYLKNHRKFEYHLWIKCLVTSYLFKKYVWWCHHRLERPLAAVLKREYFPISEIEPKQVVTLFFHDDEEDLLCYIYDPQITWSDLYFKKKICQKVDFYTLTLYSMNIYSMKRLLLTKFLFIRYQNQWHSIAQMAIEMIDLYYVRFL